MLAFITPLLLVVAGAVAQDTTQDDADCSVLAPCQSLAQLTGLQGAPPNDTLFAEADEVCGGDALQTIMPLIFACTQEVEVPVGCECVQKEQCGAAVNTLSEPCLQTLVTTLCEEAYWLDEQMMVNMRGIFQHLGNDCAGLSLSCPAETPEFDPEVCAAAPGAAPAMTATAGTAASPIDAGADTTDTTSSDAAATTDDSDAVTEEPASSAGYLGAGAVAVAVAAAAAVM